LFFLGYNNYTEITNPLAGMKKTFKMENNP
jgi:hypothetical protein